MKSLSEKCSIYKKSLLELNQNPDTQAQKRIIYQINQMIHLCLKGENNLKLTRTEADSVDLIIKTPSNLRIRIDNIIKILDKIARSEHQNLDLVRLDIYSKQAYQDLHQK
ncbi:MAG TPA: hypothetical protein PLQ36_00585 [Candidatus Gracilibacteria bacterium]|nr:hypothetical protein [Candidatus Gracilibacteria bacterium]